LSTESSPPDKDLSDTDRGDDTQRRYRYQAAYAALISLGLLKKKTEFEEIFCEHHEDILIRGKDGKFIGIQVKTRKPGIGAFTFSDREIITSLKRFLELELAYPDHFKRYVIAASCGFWQKNPNDSNLVHCLDAIRTKDPAILHNAKFLGRVKKLSNVANCNEDFVINVLRKVKTTKSPDLDAYEAYLFQALAQMPTWKRERVDTINKAAILLIDTMFRAASLSHTSAMSAYFAMLDDPETAKINQVIQGKRVTRTKVEETMQQVLKSAILLRPRTPVNLSDLPKGMKGMELKMAKGGISFLNIDNAKDLKFSAIHASTEWLYKYDPTDAIERYQHLSVIVRNECQEAYDLVKTKHRLFGEDMLKEIRKRLRSSYDREVKSKYTDCRYEHLLGIAAILTEECKIWWSEVFDLPEEVT
jgi:hypothetical protein